MKNAKSGKFVKLQLKRTIRNTIAKMLWSNASYHSNFLLHRCRIEPYIPNYNLFEAQLISDLNIYCIRSFILIESNYKYMDMLEETVMVFAEGMKGVFGQ